MQRHYLGAFLALTTLALPALTVAQVSNDGQQTSNASTIMSPRAQAKRDLIRRLEAGSAEISANIDRQLLPYYHRAKELEREGTTKDLDAYLTKVRLARLSTEEYADSKYGTWISQTLLTNLMGQDDMKGIWTAQGSPKSKKTIGYNYLNMASAAYMGFTYPGEYQLLKKELNLPSPEPESARQVDFGDCPKGVEIFALYRYNESMGDTKFTDMAKEWAIRHMYNHLLPGNDNLFLALLSDTWSSNPPAALAALRHHFPHGVPPSLMKDYGTSWLVGTIAYNVEEDAKHPPKNLGKYTGPEK